MKKLRTIFHGLNHEHGVGKLVSVRKLQDIFEVVAAVDDISSKTPTWHASWPTGEGLKLVTAEEALAMPDIDVVFVETANADLVASAMPWAKRGVAMHLDKPTGETREPFRELVSICREKNVPLQLGYMFRANPAVKFLQRSVLDGTLGKVIHIQATMDHNYGNDEYQRYLSTFKAGIHYNLCCHLLDFIAPMMEGDLVRVTSQIGAAPGDPPDSRNRCTSLLEWPGATAFVHACSRVPGGQTRRHLRADCQNGIFEMEQIERFDGQPLKATMILGKGAGCYSAGRHELDFGIQTDRYAGQLLELAAIVRGERPNPTALYDHDLRVHDILLKSCGLI